jgi:pSer/pThr/pTyr-binding forkhead associated (FHA) protein
MIICPNCKKENFVGVLFCEDCAELLHMTATLVPDEEALWLGSLKTEKPYGIHEVGGALWLMVQPEMFFLHRSVMNSGQLIMGRQESTDEHTMLRIDTPDIDELGISRVHAALLPLETGLQVEDIGSTNGTRLNGQALTPGRSYKAAHKDRIELGKLTITLHIVAKEAFLEAVSQRVMNRFSLPVQQMIKEIDLPKDAMVVLSVRLPDKDDLQLEVLNNLRDGDGDMTLELLHEGINTVLGAGISRPLVQPLGGETTASLGEELRAELDVALQDTKKSEPVDEHGSSASRKMMSELRKEGLLMERRLADFQLQAQHLPPDEREVILARVLPMLLQVQDWLLKLNANALPNKQTRAIEPGKKPPS